MEVRMIIFIEGRSALEFWRAAHSRRVASPTKAKPRRGVSPKAGDFAGVDFAGLGIIERPVSVLVGNYGDRRRIKGISCSVWDGSNLGGSFVKVNQAICVAAPEAVFLQLARRLDMVSLVKLGMELCGTYSICPAVESGFRSREPLTSVAAIDRYLARSEGVQGSRKARQALGYIADGSASPAETNAVILLCLPTSFGGFGLPKPELNRRFELPDNAKALARQRSFKCDMYWPQIHMAIEYDSDFWHSGETRRMSDAVRRNAIEHLGLTVVTMTKGQLYDARETERIALVVARRLRRYHPSVRKDLLARRYELRRAVLG